MEMTWLLLVWIFFVFCFLVLSHTSSAQISCTFSCILSHCFLNLLCFSAYLISVKHIEWSQSMIMCSFKTCLALPCLIIWKNEKRPSLSKQKKLALAAAQLLLCTTVYTVSRTICESVLMCVHVCGRVCTWCVYRNRSKGVFMFVCLCVCVTGLSNCSNLCALLHPE